MKTITRAERYVRAGNINNQWALCSKARKAYARHLVADYGWPVGLAIQHAYIHGYDQWTFDYHEGRTVRDGRKASSFGF